MRNNEPMKNPHIIVGEPRRCICGSYGHRAIGCADVIAALERIDDVAMAHEPPNKEDVAIIREVIVPLIQECNASERVSRTNSSAMTTAPQTPPSLQTVNAVGIGSSVLLAVSFGGGTNSCAMLCGFKTRGIVPALLLFADTGAEMPHTYEHVEIMRAKVREWWALEIVTVQATRHKEPWTIVQDCERKNLLPALAYGSRSCSQRFKHEPMERYLKDWMRERGVSEVVKCVGYHADEGYRVAGKPKSKLLAKGLTEHYWYPLIDWQWRQADCQAAICKFGIPQPGKSACYFCPASKRSEVLKLQEKHPELLASALRIEANAQARNRTKVGLGGGDNLWADWLAMDAAQAKLMLDIEPHELPCGCLDG